LLAFLGARTGGVLGVAAVGVDLFDGGHCGLLFYCGPRRGQKWKRPSGGTAASQRVFSIRKLACGVGVASGAGAKIGVRR
jgi:hypothetical protein